MTAADVAGQLAEYDKNRVTNTDAMNTALSTYGVPEIRNTVSGLRTTVANTTNALNSVDPSVTGRTSGSLVTEAQRSRMVANERQPIAQQLSEQTGALGQNEQDLKDALGLATTDASNKVTDYNTGRAALQDQYDRTYASEQDAAKSKAAQEENDRQYQLALKQASASSAKASTPSPAQVKQTDLGTTSQNLMSKVGKDGHVSQETWNQALSQWLAAGYTSSEFVKNNIQFVNQRFKGYHGFN
jgi:hypothetical protein